MNDSAVITAVVYDDNGGDERCTVVANFVINSIFAGLLCVLGLVGNAFSFAVLTRDTTAPLASFLLRVLAVTDNLFLAVWFVNFSLRDALVLIDVAPRGNSWWFWLHTQLYSYPLLFVCQSATIWMTVLIAVSRYLAVCQPYKAVVMCNMAAVQRGVLLVVCFSVVYNIPRYFEVRVDQHVDPATNETVYYLNRTALGASKLYDHIYFQALYYVFSFVLPLVLLSALNTKLTISYRALQRKRRRMTSVRRRESHDGSITLVMIVIVVIFMVCNAPARIVQILWGYSLQRCMTFKFFATKVSSVLEVLNSSTNFIVYCVCRRQFRDILQSRMCPTAPTLESRQTLRMSEQRPSLAAYTHQTLPYTIEGETESAV